MSEPDCSQQASAEAQYDYDYRRPQADYDALRAERDELRALLRNGIVFAANCEASPEQTAGFQETARQWREAAHAALAREKA